LEAGVPPALVGAFEHAAGFPSTWESLLALVQDAEPSQSGEDAPAVELAAASVPSAIILPTAPADSTEQRGADDHVSQTYAVQAEARMKAPSQPAVQVESQVDPETDPRPDAHAEAQADLRVEPQATVTGNCLGTAAEDPTSTTNHVAPNSQPDLRNDQSSCLAESQAAMSGLNSEPHSAGSGPQDAPSAPSGDPGDSTLDTTADMPAVTKEIQENVQPSTVNNTQLARPQSAHASLHTPVDASRKPHRRRVQTDSAGRRKRVRVVRRGPLVSQRSSTHQSAAASRETSASPLLDTSSLSALPRSRSGRSLKPPLSYWANQVSARKHV
jgi:hypothetical protein